MELFDCNVMLGRWRTGSLGSPTNADQLAQALDSYGISSALVYHATALYTNPDQGNRQLLAKIADHPTLHPAWILIPDETEEVPPHEETVADMLAAGVRAAWMFPTDWRFSFRIWNIGGLLELLQAHRFPLFVDFSSPSWSGETIDWDGIYEVCDGFPDLPVILSRSSMGSNRRLFPLLRRFPNLSIDTSYYAIHRGIEMVCKKFGAERVIFGTGMPARAPGPAISMLAYSGNGEEERALVAGGNLHRLLEGVRP
jgi:hypothetical protein